MSADEIAQRLRKAMLEQPIAFDVQQIPMLVLQAVTEGPIKEAAIDYVGNLAVLSRKYDFLPKDPAKRVVDESLLHKAERKQDKTKFPLKAQEYCEILLQHRPTLRQNFVHMMQKFNTQKWQWEYQDTPQLPYDPEVLKKKQDELKKWNLQQKYKRKHNKRDETTKKGENGTTKSRYNKKGENVLGSAKKGRPTNAGKKSKKVKIGSAEEQKQPTAQLSGDQIKELAAKAKAERKKAKKERKKEAAAAAEAPAAATPAAAAATAATAAATAAAKPEKTPEEKAAKAERKKRKREAAAEAEAAEAKRLRKAAKKAKKEKERQ